MSRCCINCLLLVSEIGSDTRQALGVGDVDGAIEFEGDMAMGLGLGAKGDVAS